MILTERLTESPYGHKKLSQFGENKFQKVPSSFSEPSAPFAQMERCLLKNSIGQHSCRLNKKKEIVEPL